MPTTEHTINDALAEVLRSTRHVWREPGVVRSENTRSLRDSVARPDILVVEPHVSPVAIETEVLPAIQVEAEARARLGQRLSSNGRLILSSIAVRLPSEMRTKDGPQLRQELTNADGLAMALFTGSTPTNSTRWPRSGWISGGIADLSFLVQSASVPPAVIQQAVEQLLGGVNDATGLLTECAISHPEALRKIAQEIRQEDSSQTRGMAATILANAFIFHENLAGGPGDLGSINSIEQIRDGEGQLTKFAVLAEWRRILQINYYPIFDIARRILEIVPTSESAELIAGLAATADRLLQSRLMRSHDLTGAVFQRLIADRKFLAAFYTMPASASLLIGLAIDPDQPPNGGAWSSADDVKSLHVADFACGTGTLLSTAYQRIGQLHELAGGNAEAIHSEIMARSLVGCDVLPAAAHLTASMLAGAHPATKYEESRIFTLAYGKQPDGSIALGSLDLLDPQAGFELLDITSRVLHGSGESEQSARASLPHRSFDLILMNPPFTRATGHEGKKLGIPNPMFAAFSSSEEEQRLMGRAIERLTRGTSAHGNAGEASIFLVLADRMIKEHGTLGLVMPLVLMSGDSWSNSRALLTKNYSNLLIVSIAGLDGADLSFSADTSMGECLVIGRKDGNGSQRATFANLFRRPDFPLQGAAAGEQIRRLRLENRCRSLEEGPVGGTQLTFGDEVIGQVLDAPVAGDDDWHLSRITDLTLAQAAYQLVHEERLWLPSMHRSDIIELPISLIGSIGKIGPYHADINGWGQGGGIRGPFDNVPVRPHSAPTYPLLWAHEASREGTLIFEADQEGIQRRGRTPSEQELIEAKVAAIWDSASHCHFNRDFRFNSQPTAMQFTARRTIGGRAWPSIRLSSIEHEKALVLWGNTSLGLLLHWMHANKEQAGRGSIGITSLATLPALDVTAIAPDRLAHAVRLFDEMSDRQFVPIHRIDEDSARKELDEKFARDVLGVSASVVAPDGPLDLLRLKLSREPSIRGSKRLR